jgi:retron-type reverse transcriptase
MDIAEARERIRTLQTARELAAYLGISYSSFVWNFRKRASASRYRTFTIPKKQGGSRVIDAPVDSVRDIQRRTSEVLATIYRPKSSVHGFTVGRSIRSNAMFHVRRRWVLNVDIKDFFTSINFGRVMKALMAPPTASSVLSQLRLRRSSPMTAGSRRVRRRRRSSQTWSSRGWMGISRNSRGECAAVTRDTRMT